MLVDGRSATELQEFLESDHSFEDYTVVSLLLYSSLSQITCHVGMAQNYSCKILNNFCSLALSRDIKFDTGFRLAPRPCLFPVYICKLNQLKLSQVSNEAF